LSSAAPTTSGIRDRFRAHIRDEVKRAALRQLATGGPQAISVNAIAKELGVSGPALYRYFTNRDDLLTELVVDAYADFAAALRSAADDEPQGGEGALRAIALAYRTWAINEPHRYRLLFSAPFPGYDAQSERLVAAAQQAMSVLLEVLSIPDGKQATVLPVELADQLVRWMGSRGLTDLQTVVAYRAVILWTRLHGLVSLEIEGNFASMGLDPQRLFDSAITEPSR
jgi:AcrR family transcriptional regulator